MLWDLSFLSKVGADVNIRNKYESTPHHKAVDRGKFDIAQLLISRGARHGESIA
jgi:ankyrin repeat protein